MAAWPRMKRLGVIVGADDIDEFEGMRRAGRKGDFDREGERDPDRAVNAGEDRADWNVS